MNNLSAIGNTGSDAKLSYTPAGDAILSFSFALQSGYGDKQVTSWLNCSLFGKRAETLAPMILKGNRIGINGEIVNRKYTTKEGDERYSLDCRLSNVTLLGAKSDSNTSASDNSEHKASKQANADPMDDLESDIPF